MNAVIKLLCASCIALCADSKAINMMRSKMHLEVSHDAESYFAASKKKAEKFVIDQTLSKTADHAEQVDIVPQFQAAHPSDAFARMHARHDEKHGAKAAQPIAQPKQLQSEATVWAHPLVLGILMGLFLIGPDHLGTLMALSTLTSGLDSFRRGFYWGVGHSIGVVLLCPIFLALEYVSSNEVSREAWEYYGDIVIGSAMIAIGSYFIYFADIYLERRAGGTYVAKGCRCHSHSPPPSTNNDSMPESVDMACTWSSSLSTTAVLKQKMLKSESSEDNALVSTWHFVRGSLLGVLQGLCCPVGMTVGTGFISRVTATASTPMLAAFVLEFVLASGIGAGFIALGWGMLTRTGSQTIVSGRVVYMATCSLLLLFGIVWLVAHSYGVVDRIDFVERIHYKLMPTEI